jgi:hypothetical protein
MKKIISAALFILAVSYSFAQDVKKNGTIYINHPYISVVTKTVDAYLKNDVAASAAAYSDTAKFWASGLKKLLTMKEALATWPDDFKKYDSVSQKPVGYPDYLEYDKDNARVVQSWWVWSGKSKKTGEWVHIRFTQFDDFNKDGKIVMEQAYGDFTPFHVNE